MKLSEVKRAVRRQSLVTYKGHKYIFHASRIFKRPNDDREDYAAELLDTKCNSIICVSLDEVELEENEDGR